MRREVNERSRDGRRRATRPRPSSSQPSSQNIGPVAYYARKLLYPTTDRLSLVVQSVSKIATPPVTVRAQRARTPHEHQVRDGAHRVHVRDASRRAELRQGANLDAPVRARPSPSSRARRGKLRVEGLVSSRGGRDDAASRGSARVERRDRPRDALDPARRRHRAVRGDGTLARALAPSRRPRLRREAKTPQGLSLRAKAHDGRPRFYPSNQSSPPPPRADLPPSSLARPRPGSLSLARRPPRASPSR